MIAPSTSSLTRQHALLAAKGGALIAIYALYGLLQERIIKGNYSTGGETTTADLKFTSAPLLVLSNRIVSLITGLALVQLRPRYSTVLPDTVSGPVASGIFSERVSRFRPSSPLWQYALVAALNNAATLSQYGSLAYLSFTTATLGKSAKMVPVLILGYVGYGRKYKSREWAGVAVVMLGIWGYLVSLPETAADEDKMTNWFGLATLLAYLLFDGLTSTTQERVFGRSKDDSNSLMGISAGVMDQMIWVNLFSSIIAFIMTCISPKSSSLPSIELLMSSRELQLHTLALSATATCGLILLFHVIATYGALVAGLIMTVRQFISVICNAVYFGNMANIPATGWIAIGLVAAGIWIKMDKRYDPPTNEMLEKEPITMDKQHKYPKIRQYLLPLLLCPFLFLSIKYASILVEDCFGSDKVYLTAESGNPIDNIVLRTLDPICPTGPLNSVRYDTNITTAIATYPRSGSSYTRTLIERATGYQTSCVYCDKPFDEFFVGECDSYSNPFLIKTHFPSELKHQHDHSVHWKTFDRYLQIVRNPIDVLWSVRSLMVTHNHSAKLNIKFKLSEHREYLAPHLQDWNLFLTYWEDAPLEGLTLRYEDIRASLFVNIGKMVDFLLPKDQQPSLERIACAMTADEEKQMYPSGKIMPFQDWEEHFDRDVIEWVINETSDHWCRLGYDRLFGEYNKDGWKGPVVCKDGYQIERTPVAGMHGPAG